MPSEQEKTLNSGIDPTALFGGLASAWNQSFEQATPSGVRGMAYYSETAPPIGGQPAGYPVNWYSFNKRGPWIVPSTGASYNYKEGVGWIPSGTLIPNGTVNTAMLADLSVTLGKLSPSGGTPGQTYVINTAGTALEFGNPVLNIPAGTLPIAKLVPGSSNQFLRTIGGTPQWDTFDGTDINAALSITLLNHAVITPGLPYQVLATDSLGNFPNWVNTQDTILDATLTVAKISPGTGNANKVATVNSSGTGVEWKTSASSTPVITVAFTSAALSIADHAAAAHSLGVVPKIISVILVCATAEHGYSIGDEVPLNQTSANQSAGSAWYPWVTTPCDATNYVVKVDPLGTPNIHIVNKTTAVVELLTPANWRFVISLYA